MIYVPDTNVLLRFAVRTDPQHSVILSAIEKLKNGGDEVRILPQTCVEFWNVFTRPANRNGFGFPIQKADHSLHLVEKIFPLLPDDENVTKSGANSFCNSACRAFRFTTRASRRQCRFTK